MAGSTPINILQTVQTYQKAELAWLLNEFVAINKTNKKFRNFNELVANLGDTVTFDTTPRYISYTGLIITEQPSVQRVQSLECSQAANVAAAYTDQQFIFNVREYMERFGMAAMKELGSLIETDILKNFTSSVVVNDPQAIDSGTTQVNSGPFRFYGNGNLPINSYTQLAQAVANFEDFGAAKHDMMAILPVANIPAIIGSGLNQFAINRNNDDAYSWELGRFANTEWNTSNLLPLHISGTIGNESAPNNVMTVVSVNDPTGTNITSITFTEPTGGTDPNAIKSGDLFQFNDGVANQPNMRFLTFIGHQACQQPVQFRAIANAATVAGTVTVQIQTINGIGLVSAQNQNQNINNAIAAGMTVTPLPSHRAGCLMSGNQYYLAMPTLPDESPFTTINMRDPDSGAAIRHYFGSQFGLNNRAYVRDAIWGSTLVSENSLRLVFPM
jgi:P22 coat protein - gene protein 5